MSSIGIDWKILVPQIINFIILFLILRWLLYKPILKILSDRKSKIEESMKLAETTKKEAEMLEIKNQEKINLVKAEAKKIIEDTRIQVMDESKNLKTLAEKEIEEMKLRSKADIEFERKKMISALKKELAELILIASGKLTRDKVKIEVQNQLVDEVIDELQKEDPSKFRK